MNYQFASFVCTFEGFEHTYESYERTYEIYEQALKAGSSYFEARFRANCSSLSFRNLYQRAGLHKAVVEISSFRAGESE